MHLALTLEKHMAKAIMRFAHLPASGLIQAQTFAPGVQDLTLGDVNIPLVIMADAAYLLLSWLMCPFPGPLDARQQRYNEALACCQCTVEQAFGHLKGHWRSLTICLEAAPQHIPCIITLACVLHNMYESRGEVFEPQSMEEACCVSQCTQQQLQQSWPARHSVTDEEHPVQQQHLGTRVQEPIASHLLAYPSE
ncbi:hypothetical protein Y1Q_0019142 [Alligator mississippiensis]|nr:hypothetical protein Y1Q_0019142 [Alligator mississippiensis]